MAKVRTARTTMAHVVRLVDQDGEAHWVSPLDPALTLSSLVRWGIEAKTEVSSERIQIIMKETVDEVAAMLWPEVRP